MNKAWLRSLAATLLVAVAPALAQTGAYLRPSRLNIPHGSAVPTACATGDFFASDSEPPGENIYYCTAGGNPGTWTKQAGAGGTGSTATDSASVVVYKDGSNYVAVRTSDGVGLWSSTDAGRAIQEAIDEVSPAGGTVLIKPGTYTYSSTTPVVRPNNTGWVNIWAYGAKIVLTDTANTALSAIREADGDVFQYVRFAGATVDASANTSGGTNIFGAFGQQRTSWKHIRLKDLEVSGGSYANGGAAISMGNYSTDVDDTYAMSLEDIEIENIRNTGGCYGVRLSSAALLGYPDSDFNATYDNIRVMNVYSDIGNNGSVEAQTALNTCTAGVHIGGYASGKNVEVGNVVCLASGDNCVEIDGAETAYVHDVDSYNSFAGGFSFYNYTDKVDASKQRVICERCNQYNTIWRSGANMSGWAVVTNKAANSHAGSFGELVIRDSEYVARTTAGGALTHFPQGIPFYPQSTDGLTGTQGLRAVTLENVRIYAKATPDESLSTYWTGMLFTSVGIDLDGDGTREPTKVTLKNIAMEVDSTHTIAGGAYPFGYRGLFFRNTYSDIDIDGLSIDADVDGTIASDYFFGIDFTNTADSFASSIQGVVRNYRLRVSGNLPSGTKAAQLGSTTYLTIPSQILFNNVDTSGVSNSSSPTDLTFGDSTNKAKTAFTSCSLREYPTGNVPGTKSASLGDISVPNVTATTALTLGSSAGTSAMYFYDSDTTTAQMSYDSIGGGSGNENLVFKKTGSTTYSATIAPETGQFVAQALPTGAVTSNSLGTGLFVAKTGAATTGFNYGFTNNVLNSAASGGIRFENNGNNKFFLHYVPSTDADGDGTTGASESGLKIENNAFAPLLTIGQGTSTTSSLISAAAENYFPQATATTARIKSATGSKYFSMTNANTSSDYSVAWNLTANCAGAGNGGVLTVNSSNQIVCEADDGGAGAAGDNVQVGGANATDANLVDTATIDFTGTGTSPTVITADVKADSIGPTQIDETATYVFSGALSIPNGTSLPSCTGSGKLYQKTDATTGQQLYACESGTMTPQGGAPASAHYYTTQAETGLSNETVLSASTGITLSSGALSVNQAFSPTWTGTHSFTGAVLAGATPLRFDGATASDSKYVQLAVPDPTSGTYTVTMPSAATTLVGRDTTDTLTNKTIASFTNGGTITVPSGTATLATTANVAASTGTSSATFGIGTGITLTNNSSGTSLGINVPLSITGGVTTTCDPTTNKDCGTNYRHNTGDVGTVGIDSSHSTVGLDSNGNPQLRNSTGVGGLWGGPVCTCSSAACAMAGCGVISIASTALTSFTGVTPKVYVFVCTTSVTSALTDGTPSTMRLNGNFNCTADDTITVVYDGTNFYEVARSAN